MASSPNGYRTVDLSPEAGKTISRFQLSLNNEGSLAGGLVYVVYGDIVLYSADGTVRPVYTNEASVGGLSGSGSSGITGVTYAAGHINNSYTPPIVSFPELTTVYYHGDQIGSSRLMTDGLGNPIWTGEFLPFGQEWNAEATVNHYKFTGQERDAETGLDYFNARHYTSQYGRFMQPDPAGMAAVDPSNPQTWNRYAYVMNNPLAFTDPSGMYWCSFTVNSGGGKSSTEWDWCPDPWEPPVQTVLVSPFGLGGCGTPGAPRCPGRNDNGGGAPQTTGFTLSIRQPNQAFKACMAANANTYSLGGSFELAGDVATGKNTNYSQYTSIVTGNSINAFLFGSTSDAAGAMAVNAPSVVSTAMGTATTFGRRTSSIMSLNLEGAGGLPRVLGSASAGVKSAFESVGDMLSLGLSFVERTSIDAAFTGAEAINCSIP